MNRARILSSIGLVFGIFSWMIPYGFSISLLTACFGLMGLYLLNKKNTLTFLLSFSSVVLSVASGTMYAYLLSGTIMPSIMFAILVVGTYFYLLFRLNKRIKLFY